MKLYLVPMWKGTVYFSYQDTSCDLLWCQNPQTRCYQCSPLHRIASAHLDVTLLNPGSTLNWWHQWLSLPFLCVRRAKRLTWNLKMNKSFWWSLGSKNIWRLRYFFNAFHQRWWKSCPTSPNTSASICFIFPTDFCTLRGGHTVRGVFSRFSGFLTQSKDVHLTINRNYSAQSSAVSVSGMQDSNTDFSKNKRL